MHRRKYATKKNGKKSVIELTAFVKAIVIIGLTLASRGDESTRLTATRHFAPVGLALMTHPFN